MKKISEKTIIESEYKIKEGILISRLNKLSNNRCQLDVLYKVSQDYSIEIFLGGMETSLEDVEHSITMIYEENKSTIKEIINDIRNGRIELCPNEVAHLI